MKQSLLFNLLLLLTLLFSTVAQAQTRRISGLVKDEIGEPIIGASILLKGTTTGTISSIDGTFELIITPDTPSPTLVVSFIGYITHEIEIGDKDHYEVVMTEDHQTLDEVVIVGYGVQAQRSLSGSISSISAKSLQGKDGKDKKATTWKRSGMADNSIRLEVGDNDFIPLEASQIAIQIDGFRVRVLMDCFFFNDKKDGLEGVFKLKLPTDATPYYFAFGETEYLDESDKEIPYIMYEPDKFNLTYKGIEDMSDREWDNVKEARIVSKQKAAKAYEQTVSANIDPALMEWGGADMFSCRVFPLAMDKLHRVVIGYDLNMTEAYDFREYILSLPKTEKDLQVDISAHHSGSLPLEIQPQLAPQYTTGGRTYYTIKNPKQKEYTIHYNSIQPVMLVQSESDDENENIAYFGANYRVELPEHMQEDIPEDAVFLLDVSLSSNPDKFNVWLKLMDEILTQNRDIIKRFGVLCFNIDHFWYKNYYEKNNYYNLNGFLTYANTLALEGATNIADALTEASVPSWLKENKAKHIFLMSDADYNWGETNKHSFIKTLHKGDRIHTYKTGLSGTNIGLLNFLSNSTNGFSFTVTGEEEAGLTAKSFRFKPWSIEEIQVEGIKDFLVSGSPTQLYNGQKLIFTGRGIPSGNIQIKVNNGMESQTLVFRDAERINSILSSRIYGQIALSYLDNYGFKAEEAAINYSTYYQVPGQYTSFLMLESESDYEEFGIDGDPDEFVEECTVDRIIKELEALDAGLSLGDPKANFIAWIERLRGNNSIIDLDPDDEFMQYLNALPDYAFDIQLKPIRYNLYTTEQQSSEEQEALADEDLRFDAIYRLSRKRQSRLGSKGDALKLLSSVVERNASDVQAIRDIAMVATDWGMGDQSYYMMKRIIDWRQGEAISYQMAADALAQSGNIDLAIIYYYICLNADWDSEYGDFQSIAALQCLKYLNKLADASVYKLTNHTKEYITHFKKQVEEILTDDDLLIKEADIVVVVSWNIDNTDIDLHVIEPTGEECFYGHTSTEIGGQLTKDVTDGYGPEMYVLKNAVPGKYHIALNYYSDSQVKTASKAKAYINVYRNWGRKDEKIVKKTILLEKVKDKEKVLNFIVK
ncbi:hypothetical protein M2459_000548 [Parabacteroides sp. PF5-5]|uniref:carboxypeptidase-like regulatory domain-containing protein n=1 Tax=unclassified Parabacteroides TaxID=2649774 RepID=UPI002474A1D7|nr:MULTISPECIES: carboxypeptidase-like regulatory domain-containing protein [unclassified Parabacteroides]MDH6303519.1 hypothetical protein [Parabacteroides sp. PH5-39]MDH6314841.1 hypothetical protein [Parabacteroides sp. PF5-13]MDH6318178.1 hypothetical protein [Parabacteroides sp. PH5-13]MDH6321890.1 hypothetical protein [Parabacteroides sp. PH5-8]MDH6326014.1 hypothetical protein [Parabacteroides sp. PH5-41]